MLQGLQLWGCGQWSGAWSFRQGVGGAEGMGSGQRLWQGVQAGFKGLQEGCVAKGLQTAGRGAAGGAEGFSHVAVGTELWAGCGRLQAGSYRQCLQV